MILNQAVLSDIIKSSRYVILPGSPNSGIRFYSICQF